MNTSRRWGPRILLVVGLLLLLGSGTAWWWQQALAAPTAATIPNTLAGLPLLEASYGTEAVAHVARLHGKSFPLSSGAYGLYGRDQAQATLWVTGTAFPLMARQMVSAMDEAIEQNESPFTPVGTHESGGRIVYELTGMGQRHYYFRAGATVIWLAAEDALAPQILAQTLAFYP